MKAMIIADSDETVRNVERYVSPLGFDSVHYRSAVKALDNIGEIEPDAVFISSGDFPRHWKAIVQFIRSDTGKDRTVIVLLTGDRFTAEDADKAIHIGVQAIVRETLDSAEDEPKLAQVFARYKSVEGPAGTARYAYENLAEKAAFMFTNPLTEAIVTGRLERLDPEGLQFRPDVPSSAADLCEGDRVGECSLKLGEDLISADCKVRKGGTILRLDFENLGERERKKIEAFIGEGL